MYVKCVRFVNDNDAKGLVLWSLTQNRHTLFCLWCSKKQKKIVEINGGERHHIYMKLNRTKIALHSMVNQQFFDLCRRQSWRLAFFFPLLLLAFNICPAILNRFFLWHTCRSLNSNNTVPISCVFFLIHFILSVCFHKYLYFSISDWTSNARCFTAS